MSERPNWTVRFLASRRRPRTQPNSKSSIRPTVRSTSRSTRSIRRINSRRSRGLPEPRLSLVDVLNIQQNRLGKPNKNKQLVFHSTGDTGNTRGPTDQNLVADKLVSDFSDYDPQDRPLFFFHLGDVIYSFGEARPIL